MVIAKQSIEVDTSVNAAYDQWARFEELPRFMEGVEEVKRQGDHQLTWVADVCGRRIEWAAEITEEKRGKRLAWKSRGGHFHSGDVTFTRLTPEKTRVDLRVEYNPHDLANALMGEFGPDEVQLRGDLECFKELIEDLDSN